MSLETLGFLARWAHLALAVAVVGACAVLLVGGRSDRPTARAWEDHVLRWLRRLVLLALASGALLLAYQAAYLSGRAAAAFEGRTLALVLFETQAGHVWLVRHGVLLLLFALVSLRADVDRPLDWVAGRGQALVLGAGALGLVAAGGHAAAVKPDPWPAVTIDAVHLLATGIWVGGLLPLALLLRAASREEGADARPYAVLAARRFSRLALAAVVALVVSGTGNVITQIGSVAALVGTPYGRLLLAKLGLLLPILALAAVNRRRLVPALSGEAATVGRPAMRRLARFVTAEAMLALLVVAIGAALGMTPPARHQQPDWPFAFRLSLGALQSAPELRLRALIGSQVAVLGMAAALAALVIRSRRGPWLASAAVLAGLGLGLGLPPLAIDAYPTTYVRPRVPYQAASIAQGARLYREHCAACHGRSGAGDGDRAATLPRRPPDLRSPHTAQHTAGDLFWWITGGIPRAAMPAFGDRLGAEARWDLVNFVRALGADTAARTLGPGVEPGRPWLVAPDFTFAVGPTPARALKDYRGRRIVLLVLYTLPDSRPRLAQLAANYNVLALLGVEVVAVPGDAAPDAIRRLGADPLILFPIVTEGAREIAAAYGLFARAPHAEFLIDRQGYVRARWAPETAPVRELNLLLADIQELNQEKAATPAADEHVH